ncbi:MAG: hypothetical protein Q9209_007633 [Squamulea sp. 1 TL-2023]
MSPLQPSDPLDGNQPGPHPSYIQIAKPYVFESRIQECILAAGITEARDEDIRLQAVAWIDTVRRVMHLPVRTYNTAVVYFHKFRLLHPDNTGFIDAAAAALFTACKIEDTLKKSRDILCAAHNEKLTAPEQVTPDDPIFENHAKIIIGIERLMLEASGFDFRNRYPQRLVLKFAKIYGVDKVTVGKTAYNMSLDLYRTFVPLKQTTPTMAIACVELAGRMLGKPVPDLESGKDYELWKLTRQEVMETLLDLLDLYTHHRSSTIVGQDHALEGFISIRIALNQEASAKKLPRFALSNREKATTKDVITNGVKEKKDSQGLTSPRSIASPKDIKSPQPIGLTSVTGTPVQGKPGLKEGTVRFMLDPERARDEKHTVAEFFKMDEEEYEVEVENDRKRDSAICMSPQFIGGSENAPHLYVDIEQDHDETIGDCGRGYLVEQENTYHQKNYMVADHEDWNWDIWREPTKRVSKMPLPDQKLAFKAALRRSDGLLAGINRPAIRSRIHVDQENHPRATGDGFKAKVLSSPTKQLPKVPLAEQGTAFQAALERCDGVAPYIRVGAFKNGRQDQDIRVKGAAAAAKQHEVSVQDRQRKNSSQKGQNRRSQ